LGEGTMNKTGLRLKQDVEDELRLDPKLSTAQIAVRVDEGAVSLLGSVDTFADRWAADEAVKRVSGVRAVTQDLTVRVPGRHLRSDPEIAIAVQRALEWDVYVPAGVTARTDGGRVTLEGQATWNYQRDAAERAVRFLAGVVGVSNLITLRPQVSAAAVKEQIELALQRQAAKDVSSIQIDTSGGKVTLSGSASSWQSIEDAASAAWAVPGVTDVVDHVKRTMTF
jgi:osmotically-inducible protein OsmY